MPVEPGRGTDGVGERLQSLPGFRRTLARMVVCSHCGQESPDEARFCAACGVGVRTCRPPRGAQGRLDRLRRPRRLDGGGRAKRPGGRARCSGGASRTRPRRAGAIRGHGREVHRRRGRGGLRCARRARGRSGAGRQGGARDPRRRARGRCRAARRGQYGRGARLAGRTPARGGGDGCGRRGQHRGQDPVGCACQRRPGR